MDEFNQDFTHEIICDGGCSHQGTDDAVCYASWRVRRADGKFRIERKEYPDAKTNNAAEYCALTGALEDLLDKIREVGHDPKLYSVLVKTDSMLVVGQLGFAGKKRWRCNKRHLQIYVEQAERLMRQFDRVHIVKVPESFMKQILGH
jgi:ribonuclease HI